MKCNQIERKKYMLEKDFIELSVILNRISREWKSLPMEDQNFVNSKIRAFTMQVAVNTALEGRGPKCGSNDSIGLDKS